MNQLTVRGFDDELAASIQRLAKQDGTSLNQAALKLLHKGAGLAADREKPVAIGSSLDDLFGTWSREEAEAFNAALDIFESVDESAWCRSKDQSGPLPQFCPSCWGQDGQLLLYNYGRSCNGGVPGPP